jgi:hypothetical protein
VCIRHLYPITGLGVRRLPLGRESYISKMEFIIKYSSLGSCIPRPIVHPTTHLIPTRHAFTLSTPPSWIHNPIPQRISHGLVTHKPSFTPRGVPLPPAHIPPYSSIHIATEISLHNHLLFVQHLRHTPPVSVHDDTGFVQGVFDWLFRVEDFANLLEGAAPCFDEEEVDDDELEYVPEDE